LPETELTENSSPDAGDRALGRQTNGGVSALDMVKVACSAALDKKASDVVVLDVAEQLYVTDYFVIATAGNERQAQAVADEIERKLREELRVHLKGREGERDAKWILLDFTDIVVHIFQPDYRDEYRLEKLWAQSRKLRAEALEAASCD
jgi:ribosome-associated protein